MVKVVKTLPKPKEGCISYRQSDGRFMGKYKGADGLYKYVYDYSYMFCLQKLESAIVYRDTGMYDIRLFDWLDRYLELYKKKKVAPETFDTYKGYVKNYFRCNGKRQIKVNYKLQNLYIRDIKGDMLQEFLLAIEKGRTRESIKNLLTGAFGKAHALGYIERNPLLAVEIPKHKRIVGKYCSDDVVKSFFDNLYNYSFKNKQFEIDNLAAYYKYLLYTGCRRGEGLIACKSDFDFENGMHHIRGTKTDGSDRYIPLFDNVGEIVKGISKFRLFKYNEDFVTEIFTKCCPGHTLKDLRKTFATNCRRSGIPIDVVQAWLGHTEIETTQHHYIDILPEIHREFAKQLKCLKIE